MINEYRDYVTLSFPTIMTPWSVLTDIPEVQTLFPDANVELQVETWMLMAFVFECFVYFFIDAEYIFNHFSK